MPKRIDHAERRWEISLGVFQVIAERGISAVSLRSVAAAASVSMGRVQHYFTTKDDLVHHACRVFVDQAEQRFMSTDGDSAPARLQHLLTMGLPDTADGRVGSAVWYSFVTAAATDDSLAEIIRDAWSGLRASILLAFPTVSPPEPGRALEADALAALVDGLTLRVMLGAMTPGQARSVLERQLAALAPNVP
ncbi:MAG: TetR/AcrR family transcriptional regulator [Propionibacteriaceae bacterium]